MKSISVPIKYGLIIAIGLIVYFLILSLFGAHRYPIYSFFNSVIMGVGMYFAMKTYRKEKGTKFEYQKGFFAGLLTGVNATIIFTIFFGLYATEFHPGFLEELIFIWKTDWFINIGMLLFTVALMGIATSLVLSLTFMQLLKDSWNTTKAKKHTV